MACADQETRLSPSFLDRLVGCSVEGVSSRPWYTLEQVIDAVQHDLENLINTRQTHQGLCDELPEAQRSILTFGVPDLGAMDALTPHKREQIARYIESAIELFEPRLSNVRVEPVEGEKEQERKLHFRVVARLSTEPSAYVTFDTTLQLSSGRYSLAQAET